MIEINNLTGFKIDKKIFKKIVGDIFKNEKIKLRSAISIAIVSSEEIKSLNKKYRKKNRPTDVLAFEEVNEIVICPVAVRENAKRFRSTFKKELMQVLIHGILHLLGYDHEKGKKGSEEMREKEKYYFSKIRY